MLDLKEKGFAAKLLSGDDLVDTAKGPSFERGLAAHAVNLRVWDKTGHLAAGFSWSSYDTDEWEESGAIEKLTLVFASRYLILYGHHLRGFLAQIDEGRLKHITELDGPASMELMAENASIRDEARKTPIVIRFEVGPKIGDLVNALKGEKE